MSVILDALRRARGAAPPRRAAAPPPAAGIPAGLRVGQTPAAASRRPRTKAGQGETRWPLLVGVIVLAAVIYGGVRYGLPLMLPTESRMALVQPDDGAPVAAPAAATPTPADASAAPGTPGSSISVVQPEAGMPGSLTEMIERIQEPPAIAPRAMPTPRPSTAAAAPATAAPSTAAPSTAAPGTTAPRTVAPRTVVPRPPVPVTPAPEVIVPAAAAAPMAPPVNHMELAVQYHNLGNFEQALTHYNAVIAADELNVAARNNLGLLYSTRGLTAEAVAQFERAIRINPQYVNARSNLSVVLMNAGRLAEARAHLRSALAAEPRNASLLVNMALVEKADRQPDAAKAVLLQALGIDPGHVDAHYNLAVLHDEAGDGARALEHYSEFLRRAGPEHGVRLTDVRRRMDALSPPARRVTDN